MQRFKFKSDDLFINRLKTYPEYNLFIYQSELFINSDSRISGSGGLVVHDSDRNLEGSGDNRVRPFVVDSSKKLAFKNQKYQPLVEYSGDFSWISSYVGGVATATVTASTTDYSSISFVPGDFTNEQHNVSSYSQRSPITRKLTSHTSDFTGEFYNLISHAVESSTITFLSHNPTASALQNVARKYTTLSDHFILTSTPRRLRDLVYDKGQINFIFIPSMYYGSTIKKGSVELNYYLTGSKTATCADINHNGTLIGTTGSTSGSVVGLVLYDEGIIMLTSSTNLETGPALGIRYDGTNPLLSSWKYYGTTLNDGTTHPTLASASYDLNFKGTNYINTMTMFAHAQKGQLNHSNNPTYRSYSDGTSRQTGSGKFFHEGEYTINNIVSASYVSASFEKTTYISKVHIYDEDGNLIAITSVAKPVKKTLNDEFTFKMKLDL